jgi:Icc-related predicted phosphoesterase
MNPWFFTNDLHGQGAFYEQLLAIVAARRPRAVIIGGDLAPHATGVEGVRRQRLFLEGLLVEFARRLRDASPTSELLLMMGNDDWAANEDVLGRHDGGLWRSLHERVVEVDGVAVAGCSWVPITPFGIKDWERWEDGDEESPPRLDGWTSRGGHLAPMRFDPAHRAPSIAGSLRDLAARTAAGEAVWVSHGPPRDTRCDVLNGGAHVGSRALRRFVEEHQPPLVLSGHIHESARVSGSYHDRIGRTVVVNPGQFGTSRLCGVWFDPLRVAETLAHTVHR